MIKEFRSTTREEQITDDKDVVNLIVSGNFGKAYKLCKKIGEPFEKFDNHFEKGVRKAILSRKVGELLSFIYSHPNILKNDPLTLLKELFAYGDYHGFLKNCYRFKVEVQLKEKILLAIHKVRKEEGDAWKKKFTLH